MARSTEGYLWTPEGSTNGLETRSAVATSCLNTDEYDIIVVGAGFAGLAAARDISQHTSAKVLLVEARDRIGGRTWTAQVAGENIEMGGTWVHWNQPHFYHELQRYGMHRHLKTSSGAFAPMKQYYKDLERDTREISATDASDTMERVAAKLFQVGGHDSRSLMPFPHDPLREPAPWKSYDHLSIQDRLDQLQDVPDDDKVFYESFINSIGSAPGKETGFVEILRWYALGGHTMAGMFELAGLYKIGGQGMTGLALAMLEDFKGDTVLNSPIRAVKQDRNGVTIMTKSGNAIRAKALISTIPLNCLNDIVISPPLSPLRQQALREGHINKGSKIHFKLKNTLPGWFSSCAPPPASPFCFGFSDHNGTQPSGPDGTWCIGFGYGGQFKDKTDHEHIISEFKRTLNPEADVALYAMHDWANDEYAKGEWSCWGPGQTSKYLGELQKEDGRILFASADWADGWRGFVDGALERGKLAAKQVTKFLGPSIQAKL